MEIIRFYSTNGQYGCFSNFSRHKVWIDEQYWNTNEHYFQAMKFKGSTWADAIRKASSPSKAAEMGRSRKHKLRENWDHIRDEIMYSVNLAKYVQHQDIRKILIDTGDTILVEHTENDNYWGDGGDGTGKNMLGKTLMRVRNNFADIAKNQF